MTSQKGVVTAPGRRPEPSVLRGGARRGRGVGALTDPLPRPGRRRGRARKEPRRGWAASLSPPRSGPCGRGAYLPQASLATQGGCRQADPALGGLGIAGSAGDFPSRGPEHRECKGGLQFEAGKIWRRPPEPRACVDLSVGAFVAGRPPTPSLGPDKLGLRIGRTRTHPQLAQAPCKRLDPEVLAPEGAILARGGPLQAPAGNGPGHAQAPSRGRRPSRSARLS